MRIWLAMMVTGWLPLQAGAALKTEAVDSKDGDKVLQGYFAWDDAVQGKRPAVLVVHEWAGHGPYARRRAEQLAGFGYLAFACDMYGKGVFAKDHEEAGKLAGVYQADRSLMRSRAHAGLARMLKHPLADPARAAAIGYCFGATTVLELARAGEDLRGVVSFHGGLATTKPAEHGKVKAKVLVCQGGADKWTMAGLVPLEDELTAAGADWQVEIYSGAVHSFTVKEAGSDPKTGMAYNEAADRHSWEAMREFLAEVLK